MPRIAPPVRHDTSRPIEVRAVSPLDAVVDQRDLQRQPDGERADQQTRREHERVARQERRHERADEHRDDGDPK